MKNILLFLGLMLSFSSFAQYTYIEANTQLGEDFAPTISLYHENALGDNWGYTDYIAVTEGWGELLPGLYIKPTDDFLIGAYAGLQTSDPALRFGANLAYTFSDRLKASVFAEKGDGKENYWYDAQLTWQAFNLGSFDVYLVPRERYGYGTALGLSLGKNDLVGTANGYLTFSPFYDWDTEDFRHTLFLALEF